eukprot:superscaffoldBa00000022_g430
MSFYHSDQETSNLVLLRRSGQDGSGYSPFSSSPAGNQSAQHPLDNLNCMGCNGKAVCRPCRPAVTAK